MTHNMNCLSQNQLQESFPSSTQQLLMEDEQCFIKKKSKCHGNRKLQHFKRKYRSRGFNEEQIAIIIQQRNRTISEQFSTNQMIHDNDHRQQYKRQRDLSTQELLNGSITSSGQLSTSQEPSKKVKVSSEKTMLCNMNQSSQSISEENCTIYKPSKYLKMPRKLLLRSLRLQLNHPLKKKPEQNFVLSRLQTLDQRFCIEQIHSLYETYFNQGSQYQIWPDDILKIIQSDRASVIQKYLEDYLILLRTRIYTYSTELVVQSSSCPSTLDSLENIDKRLQQFVRLHHFDLLRVVNYRMKKLNDKIYEKQLYKQLSYYDLTSEQFEAIDHLTTIRRKQLKVFEDLTMFEQRILCHKLPKSYDCLDVDIDQKQSRNKRTKIIQDLKRRMLNVELEQYEIKIQYYERSYQKELTILYSQISNPTSHDHQCQVYTLLRFLKSYFDHYTNLLLRQIRYKESCFHAKLLRHRRQHSVLKKKTIDIYPQIIVDIPNVSLNRSQLDYLSYNGPNYVRPNQTYLHSYKSRLKQIEREYNRLLNVIIPCLARVHYMSYTSTIIQQFSQELAARLFERYMAPISYLHIDRARQELKLMKSIQRRLRKENYVLRVTDKSGIFHLGRAKDYEQKAEAYRQQTGAYLELANDPLWTVFDKVVHLLNDLRFKKHIFAWQLDKMMPKRDKVKLAHLYFIPKPHKEGTPLRPIVSSMNAPTTGISKFLDQILRPLFDKHVRSTTIIDGVDLIHRLETYATNGYIKPTTYLCTFDITNLYTMLPQEESLNILTEFLIQHSYKKVKGIPIDAIRKLARIVLTENVFTHNKKFYRQILGGAMGSAFTLTLANIFMWKWEKEFVRRLTASNEIYGRYIDDIFFTSNESLDTTNEWLDQANRFHPNIKLVRQIGHSVPFLDLLIENNNGRLITSVYHKEAAEPYIVPFKSDHPPHVLRNIIDNALLRAVRYSSTLSAFNQERRSIKLMLLYNGYPPRYIYSRFIKFFTKYLSLSTLSLLIDNENDFAVLRSILLNKPTFSEHQTTSRIATTVEHTEKDITDNPLVQSKLDQGSKWLNRLIIHYIYEKRLQSYKKDVHLLWHKTFEKTPVRTTRLIVGNRSRPNLTKELVDRRRSDI